MSKMLSILEASKLYNTSTVAVYRKLGRLKKRDKEGYYKVTKRVNKVLYIDAEYLRKGTIDIENVEKVEKAEVLTPDSSTLEWFKGHVEKLQKDLVDMDLRHNKQIETMQLRSEEQQRYLNNQIVGLSKMLGEGSPVNGGVGGGVPSVTSQESGTPIAVETVTEADSSTNKPVGNVVKSTTNLKIDKLIMLILPAIVVVVLFYFVWKFRGNF